MLWWSDMMIWWSDMMIWHDGMMAWYGDLMIRCYDTVMWWYEMVICWWDTLSFACFALFSSTLLRLFFAVCSFVLLYLLCFAFFALLVPLSYCREREYVAASLDSADTLKPFPCADFCPNSWPNLKSGPQTQHRSSGLKAWSKKTYLGQEGHEKVMLRSSKFNVA